MRLYQISNAAEGDRVTPHEVNAELRHQIGELNGGIDLENISGATLAEADIKSGEWMDYIYSASDPSQAQALRDDSGRGTEQSLRLGSSSYAKHTITTKRTAMLTVHVGALLLADSTNCCNWVLRVRIDGELVAESGTNGWGTLQSRQVSGGLVVPAGEHTIETTILYPDPEGVEMTLESYNCLAIATYW